MANTLNLGTNGNWAVKDGSLLGYNNENNNFKPLPFDFTRASSATRVNQQGLIETVASGVPRIDYTDANGALLLEPQRTNLIPYSQKLNIGWGLSTNITAIDNVSISLDGSQNASTIIGANDTTFNSVNKSTSVTINSTNTFSLFIKKVEIQTNYLGIGMVYTGGTTDVCYVSFDSVNGIARNMDSRITAILNVVDFGTYWRLEITSTDDGSNTSLRVDIYATLSLNGTTVSFGASSARTIWGMQLEINSSYATSYIPTQGSAVTRIADACNNGGNDQVINSAEGTMFLDCDFINNSAVQVLCSIHDNSASKRLEIFSTSNVINGFIGAGSNITVGSSALTNGRHKIALAYKSGDSSFYIDGVLIGSSSSSFTISALTELSFGYFGGILNSECKTNDVQVYNTRLTNAELQALTTI